MPWDADVAVIGAGAAGLSLAVDLVQTHSKGKAAPTVIVVEAPPGPLRPAARTWCYWEAGTGPYDSLLSGSWDRLRVYGSDGSAIDQHLGPLRYKMLRSDRFEAAMTDRLGVYGVGLRRLSVESVHDDDVGAVVHGRDVRGVPSVLRAGLVFDSRPPQWLPAARTTLLQHFRGWFVRTALPAFDPGAATLMDFRLPQPVCGLAFGYVLPLGQHAALVEYTEFSRRVLDDAAYERALGQYCTSVLGLSDYTVVEREQGVIPMTDGRFPRSTGRRVHLIGAAGGATRPSTGYTFAAIQRQSRQLAAAVRAGRSPARTPPVHGARVRAMDAVLLRALDTGRIDGGAFFAHLFSSVPAERVLRFMDGATSPWEDLGIGLRTPVRPMLRSLLELPLLRRSVPASGPGRR
ncbi:MULTISPECIES: lycopene cyclase family protein [Streptomyces]|uniref:lycopene cyclase family protein n=1 Tax=Streptomyces TaxID=1883 RepID=UPI00017E8599|nr:MULTISPECIES: lycopene cyclase family protein [unclassified Streptomyces]AKL64212.1 lycopene cyclase [Streptomyces sp. Mg1]EDX21178.1 lycopene cyclase [Streptomyces sp. Mg1]RPK44628.1 Lycopene cyclase protein [Streptomyces sp. ADI91-18]WSX95773.1 lycopene cyclase family protein [Streptomyces goshikiensis]